MPKVKVQNPGEEKVKLLIRPEDGEHILSLRLEEAEARAREETQKLAQENASPQEDR